MSPLFVWLFSSRGGGVKDVYGKQINSKLYLDENLMLITWSIQFIKSALYASQTSIRSLIPLDSNSCVIWAGTSCTVYAFSCTVHRRVHRILARGGASCCTKRGKFFPPTLGEFCHPPGLKNAVILYLVYYMLPM